MTRTIPVDRTGDALVVLTLGLFVALLLVPMPGKQESRAQATSVADRPPEPERAPAREREPAPAREQAPLRADEWPLRVRVRGPAGEPVPCASVIAFGPDPEQPAQLARSLGDGEFELRLRRGAPGCVAAVASGWCSAEPVDVDPARPVPALELRLRPFAALRGHLRDAQGRPLANVGFELHEQVAGEDPASPHGRARRYGDVPAGGRTEADGSFAVAGLASGARYRMELLPGPWNSRPCRAFEGLEPRDEPAELVCEPSADAPQR